MTLPVFSILAVQLTFNVALWGGGIAIAVYIVVTLVRINRLLKRWLADG